MVFALRGANFARATANYVHTSNISNDNKITITKPYLFKTRPPVFTNPWPNLASARTGVICKAPSLTSTFSSVFIYTTNS